jgi:putative membrane protein
MIWVNVALPPTTEQPLYAKGKTPASELSEHRLRRRKIEALRLCLSFAYAVKHYLRGEDGTKWDDYGDILPPWLMRDDTQKRAPVSYAATMDSSKDSNESGRSTPDATKRVRVKRSKQNLSSQSAPLLANRNAEYPFADQMSLPFPLVSVY